MISKLYKRDVTTAQITWMEMMGFQKVAVSHHTKSGRRPPHNCHTIALMQEPALTLVLQHPVLSGKKNFSTTWIIGIKCHYNTISFSHHQSHRNSSVGRSHRQTGDFKTS